MRSVLNNYQKKTLVEICIVVGQLAAASMVLPFIVPGFDRTKVFVIILGLLMTFAFWTLAIMLARKVR